MRYAGEEKGLGLSGTKHFLLERGVPREIVDETTRRSMRSRSRGGFSIKKLWAWSKSSRSDQSLLKKRLYGFFSRRGYAPKQSERLWKNTLLRRIIHEAWFTVWNTFLVVLVSLSGCTKSVRYSQDEIKDFPPEVQEQIKQGTVALGMTIQQVRFAWGPPSEINVLQPSEDGKPREEWIYSRS